jgi:hypothetical protein
MFATLFYLFLTLIPTYAQLVDGHTYQINFPTSPRVSFGLLTTGTDGQHTVSSPGVLGATATMPALSQITLANSPGWTQVFSLSMKPGKGVAETALTVRSSVSFSRYLLMIRMQCVVGDIPGATVAPSITRTWSFDPATTIHFPTHVMNGDVYITCNPTVVPTGVPKA